MAFLVDPEEFLGTGETPGGPATQPSAPAFKVAPEDFLKTTPPQFRPTFRVSPDDFLKQPSPASTSVPPPQPPSVSEDTGDEYEDIRAPASAYAAPIRYGRNQQGQLVSKWNGSNWVDLFTGKQVGTPAKEEAGPQYGPGRDFAAPQPQAAPPAAAVPGMEQLGGVPPGPAAPPEIPIPAAWNPAAATAKVAQFLAPGITRQQQFFHKASENIADFIIQGAQMGGPGALPPLPPEAGQAQQYQEQAGKLAESYQKPLLPFSELAPGQGFVKGAARAAEQLTTPINASLIASIPALGTVAAAAPGMLPMVVHDAASLGMDAYFAQGIARGTIQAGSKAVTDYKAQDWEALRQDLGYGSVDAMVLAAAGYAGAKRIGEIADAYTVSRGPLPGPKAFGDMTDEELVAHRNSIEQDPPPNYDWQKEQIAQEVLQRQAGRGMPAGAPGEGPAAPPPPAAAPPAVPETPPPAAAPAPQAAPDLEGWRPVQAAPRAPQEPAAAAAPAAAVPPPVPAAPPGMPPAAGAAQRPEGRSGEDLIRGSTNIPLSPQGVEQANQIAQRFAQKGGLDLVVSSDMDRAVQTAAPIAQASGAYFSHATEGLHPWYLGEVEGQPTDKVLDRLNGFIDKTPDKSVPGRSEGSTQDGEAFNTFKERAIGTVQDLMDQYSEAQANDQPVKIAAVTHYRDVKLLHAWADSGFPENLDKFHPSSEEMTGKDDPPGSVQRISQDAKGDWQMQPVDMTSDTALEPGIYIVRHSPTVYNAENRNIPAPPVGQMPQAQTPVRTPLPPPSVAQTPQPVTPTGGILPTPAPPGTVPAPPQGQGAEIAPVRTPSGATVTPNTVSMERADFEKEHTDLPRILREGTPAEREKEAAEQAQELKEVQAVNAREPGWVGNVPTSEIKVDAPRFQFKANVGQGGVGEESRDITTWDPEKSGVLAVWKDPADGQTYVVNGHNRLDLANRLNVPEVTARYLVANNAQEARLKGALINIAEGRGEPTDAAKVFRDSGMTPEQLRERGVSIKGKVASEGLALSNLSQPIFDDVINGTLPVARGAVIGAGVPNHADQQPLYDLMRQREQGGKRLTNDQIEELIRLNQRTSTVTERPENQAQTSMFGEEEMTRSLLPEKAEISDYVRKQLAVEKKLFGTVAAAPAAERLTEAGNVVLTTRNAQIAASANQGMLLYDRLSTVAGPIDSILDTSAKALAGGESAHEVKQSAYRQVRNLLAAHVRKLTGVPQGNDRGAAGLGKQGPLQAGAGEHGNALQSRAIGQPQAQQSFLVPETEAESRAIAQSNEARLLRDRLTAQIASGGAARPTKIKPAKTRALFGEEAPEQGTLFARGLKTTPEMFRRVSEVTPGGRGAWVYQGKVIDAGTELHAQVAQRALPGSLFQEAVGKLMGEGAIRVRGENLEMHQHALDSVNLQPAVEQAVKEAQRKRAREIGVEVRTSPDHAEYLTVPLPEVGEFLASPRQYMRSGQGISALQSREVPKPSGPGDNPPQTQPQTPEGEILYHGTPHSFAEFRQNELGIHFGTKEQALSRIKKLSAGEGRLITARLRGNPKFLEMADLGSFDSLKELTHSNALQQVLGAPYLKEMRSGWLRMFNGLFEKYGTDPQDMLKGIKPEFRGTAASEQRNWEEARFNDIRQKLMAKGFDGLKYPNAHEGSGYSYDVFDPQKTLDILSEPTAQQSPAALEARRRFVSPNQLNLFGERSTSTEDLARPQEAITKRLYSVDPSSIQRLPDSPVPTSTTDRQQTAAYWQSAAARAETLNGRPALYVNAAAMDVILRRMGPVAYRENAAGVLGVTLSPKERAKVVSEARTAAEDPRLGGFDDALIRVANEIQNMPGTRAIRKAREPLPETPQLQLARAEGTQSGEQVLPQFEHPSEIVPPEGAQPLMVVQAGQSVPDADLKRVAEEEYDHAAQIALPEGLRGLPAQIVETPAGMKAAGSLAQHGYPDLWARSSSPFYEHNRAVMAAEIGARLMRTGRYQELGLTAQEARDLASNYIVGLEKKNGSEAASIVDQIRQAVLAGETAQPRRRAGGDAQYQVGPESLAARGTRGPPEVPGQPVSGYEAQPVAARGASEKIGVPLERPKLRAPDLSSPENLVRSADSRYEALRPGRPGHIYVNYGAQKILAQALTTAGYPSGDFGGVALDRQMATDAQRVLTTLASATPEHIAAPMRDLAGAIGAALADSPAAITVVQSNPGTPALEVRLARKHEEFHRQQIIRTKPGRFWMDHVDAETLKSDPAIKLAYDAIRAARPQLPSDQDVFLELGAMLGTGEYARLGLTPQEGDEAFYQYYKYIKAEHGPEMGGIIDYAHARVATYVRLRSGEAEKRGAVEGPRAVHPGQPSAVEPGGGGGDTEVRPPGGGDRSPLRGVSEGPRRGVPLEAGRVDFPQPLAARAPKVGGEESRPVREFLGEEAGASRVGEILKADIKEALALKSKRDAAIQALEEAKADPAVKDLADRLASAYLAERNLWTTRVNQVIGRLRKLVPSPIEQEGIAIMRDMYGRPGELQQWAAGTHPNLATLDTEQRAAFMHNIGRLGPAIERAENPTPQMIQADQVLTKMARATMMEGQMRGIIERGLTPERYFTHLLWPKGEGEVPKPASDRIGKMLGGKISRYFAFAEHRSYPTIFDAIADGVRPKTLNAFDAATIHGDKFATARATRILQDELEENHMGVWGAPRAPSIPENWVELAPHARLFRNEIPVTDQEGKQTFALQTFWTPQAVSDALRPITDPDYMRVVKGFGSLRARQALLKQAALSLSLFHARALNLMAVFNLGPVGMTKGLLWFKQLGQGMSSPDFERAERQFVLDGGTTTMTGKSVEAYKSLEPGSIPTWTDIWRKAPLVREIDQAAGGITRGTFDILQRMWKVTDYQVKRTAWMGKHPNATQSELSGAGESIAKEINAVYGGLNWEKLGVNHATVEILRAIQLAPDWTFSNLFNVKYATEKGTAGKLARAFWMRVAAYGLGATALASLMLTGKLSKRPTQVYMGHDKDGREIYQNWFFAGAPQDVTSLIDNADRYGAVGGLVRTMASKAAPIFRTGLDLAKQEDFLGRPIVPKQMNWTAKTVREAMYTAKGLAPIPFSFRNAWDMLAGPDKDRYSPGEAVTTLLTGTPPRHVAPQKDQQGTPLPWYEQIKTGKVYEKKPAALPLQLRQAFPAPPRLPKLPGQQQRTR